MLYVILIVVGLLILKGIGKLVIEIREEGEVINKAREEAKRWYNQVPPEKRAKIEAEMRLERHDGGDSRPLTKKEIAEAVRDGIAKSEYEHGKPIGSYGLSDDIL